MSVLSVTGRFVGGLRFGEVQQHRNLAYVPILGQRGTQEHPTDYVMIGDALGRQQVRITESGRVEDTNIESLVDKPVFVPSGTCIVGGAQDRMVQLSVIVGGRQSGKIPVRCTQQSRWENPGGGAEFSVPKTGSMAASSLLSANTMHGQSGVWRSVSDTIVSTTTTTHTRRLADVVEQREESITEFLENIEIGGGYDNVFGAFFMVTRPTRSRVTTQWLLDIFGRQDLMQHAGRPLLEGAAIAALNSPIDENVPQADIDKAVEFLARLREALITHADTFQETALPINQGTLSTSSNVGINGLTVYVLEDGGFPVHVAVRNAA